MNEELKINGFITLELTRDGVLKDKREVKNLITTAGKAEVVNLCGNISSPDYFDYLALGTGTTPAAAADTTLETESSADGLARAAATVTSVTTTTANDTLQLVKEFTAGTGVTAAITECGILNKSSLGTLLGRQVFDAVNMVAGDVLTVTYRVKFA